MALEGEIRRVTKPVPQVKASAADPHAASVGLRVEYGGMNYELSSRRERGKDGIEGEGRRRLLDIFHRFSPNTKKISRIFQKFPKNFRS